MESQSYSQIFSNQLLKSSKRKRLWKSRAPRLTTILLFSVIALFILPICAFAQAISWTGDGDGTSWNQAENWSENRIPGPTDDVVITLDGTYTIQQPSGNITINSLIFGADEGTQTLIKTMSNFALNAASTIGPNGSLQMNAGYLVGEGSLENSGLIISDALGWSGLNNFTLVNNGVIEHVSGIFYMSAGSVLENNGLFDIQGDINIIQSNAASLFINNDRILKSGSADGHSVISVPIDSRPQSVIQSDAGELRLQGASVYHNTTFVADETGTGILLQTSTHTFRGTVGGSPTGLVMLNSPAAAHDSGATLDFGGTGLTWKSNYMTGGGTFTNAGLIRLDAAGWTGLNGSTLINEGTIEHLDGIFYLSSASTLQNDGLFDIQSDSDVIQSNAASLFINNDRILKSGSADRYSIISVPIDSRPQSVIQSDSGELRLQGASIYHNTTFVTNETGTSILMQTATHTFRGTVGGSPAGLVMLNSPAEAHESGATLDFGGTGLTWKSNYMTGGGTFTNTGLIRLDAAGWTGLNGSTLINEGTIEHLDGIFYLSSASTLQNDGLFDIQSDSDVIQSNAASLFINNNRILKSESADEHSIISVPIDSRPQSVIQSDAGELRLQGASVYHNTTFVADETGTGILMQTATHTFRGTVGGSPGGLVMLNSPAEAHESGATLDFGGTGLTWKSNYMTGGGTFTNAGLIRLDAAGWTGVNGSTLINEGTIEHLDGIFYLTNISVLENNGLYHANGGSGIIQSGSGSTLQNNGRLEIESSTNQYTISTTIENSPSATLSAVSGEVRLTGNGLHNNPSFLVSKDASLLFYSGTHMFNGNITSSPAGEFIIRTNFGSDSGTTQFNISETGLRWDNGRLIEGTITNSGLVTMSGSGATGITSGTFINTGDVTLTGGSFQIMTGSEFQNRSTFTATNNFNIFSSSQAPGRFINSGLFHKSGGETVSQISSQMINESTGEIRLDAGDIRYLSVFEHLENARLTGTGSIDLAQATSLLKGVFSPGSPDGILTYTGDYQPNDTTAVLDILLYQTDTETPMSANSMLSVKETEYRVGFRPIGGMATLAGELNIETEMDFIPEPGTEFEIIRAENGFTGGFSSYSGIVDVVNQRAYYPQIRDTSLILLTTDEIPSLSGTILADPVSIQAGEERMITFTGSGFPPDLAVELTCLECNEPELFGSITGRVASISPDTADVWFDVSNARISGSYEAVLSDPRGGEATAQITINQGPIELSVHVLKESTTGQDNTGLFVIRANRTSQELISVPYSLYGSAQQYVHYTTDLLGGTIPFPAGSDSVVVSIIPLQTETAQTYSVGLQIEQAGQGPNVAGRSNSTTFASMQIETRPTSTGDFRILNYTPKSGGNVGFVTMTVTGIGFTESSSLQLSGGIIAQNISVNETGSKLSGVFNLTGQSEGIRDIIVTDGSDNSETIPGGFTINTGIYPDVFVQVMAPERVPRIRQRSYTIILQNQGNVNVSGFAALSGLPPNADWELVGVDVRRANGNVVPWHEFVPIKTFDDYIMIETPNINLAAGETRKLTIKASIPESVDMRLVAAWFYK